MKAIKRIIASVFVCMFAVTGGLNALALTPTEDSSTVVSQPVSEGISSETSSQTGSVSSGLSSRADDSGLKNESSSSRTPEASSVVDSENSQSSSEPASSGNNSTSLSASAGMPSAEISSSTEAKQAATTVDVSYKTHVQTFGWQDWAANGASAGTTGLAKRLEAIQIKTSAPASQGGIRYRTHVQTYGWLDWVSDGASSGTTGEAKRLEAIQIELTGALATQYDVYYRVHAQTFGWLDWACNGASAGSAGYAKRLEAIQIVLVPKGGKAPGSTAAPYKELPPAVSYQSYLSGAWQNSVLDNAVSGTVGQAKQIEGIKISLQDKAVSFAGSSIQYRTYLQTYAWQDWTSNGGTSGKPGSGKRVEAVQIKLTGSIASSYDVYYRVHSQTFGWLDWACNGQSAGSAGYAKRIEAIQIVLVKKGGAAPGSTATPYKEAPPSVTYQTYISGGWQPTVADKATSGLAGQGKKTEGLRVSLKAGAQSLGNSSVKYRTYLQTYGWQNWVSNGASSAKAGSGKRMEAIEISLTGDISSQYDIYYRSYVTGYGWLDWACNGQSAGSAGYAKRIEAIQIVLVKKGGAAPGSTATPYKEAPPSVTYQTYISGGWQPTVADKATSGLAGQGKKTEGLRVSLKAGAQSLGNSSVKYRTYLQTYGWQNWVSNGASSAKAGSGKRMEAIEISLTGDISSQYDIYYRSYVTGYGWLGWACNGATSGTTDYAKPIEAVQAVLVKKGGAAPGSTSNAYLKPEVTGPFEISFSPSGASNFGGLVSIEPDHDVVLVASAKGGAGGYQYRYRAELIGGSIQTLKDYSGSSSYTWRPNTPGRYKMYVDVKDSTGTVKTAMFQMSVGLSGIDVSEHQGTIDWKKVKAAGIDYAMIRAGFGWEEIDDQTDASLVQNVTGAKQAGLPFGLYHYSYADTVEEAKKEAEFLLDILEANNIAPSDLSYPIAFDIEEPDRLNVSQRRVNTDMVNAFCEIIRDAGYLPMVYASKTVIQDYLYYDEISANNIWMAAWTSTPNDTEIFDNCFPVDMWQYSESGTVDGINGRVDLNICYTTVFRDGSADTTQKGKVVVDAGSSLNVRKAPNINADVVGSLYKDDIVTIISETSGWYQIVTSTGVSGYVSAEYIQKI